MKRTNDLNEIVPLVTELEQENIGGNSYVTAASPVVGGVAINHPLSGLTMTPIASQPMYGNLPLNTQVVNQGFGTSFGTGVMQPVLFSGTTPVYATGTPVTSVLGGTSPFFATGATQSPISGGQFIPTNIGSMVQ